MYTPVFLKPASFLEIKSVATYNYKTYSSRTGSVFLNPYYKMFLKDRNGLPTKNSYRTRESSSFLDKILHHHDGLYRGNSLLSADTMGLIRDMINSNMSNVVPATTIPVIADKLIDEMSLVVAFPFRAQLARISPSPEIILPYCKELNSGALKALSNNLDDIKFVADAIGVPCKDGNKYVVPCCSKQMVKLGVLLYYAGYSVKFLSTLSIKGLLSAFKLTVSILQTDNSSNVKFITQDVAVEDSRKVVNKEELEFMTNLVKTRKFRDE